MSSERHSQIFGVMGEFSTPEDLLAAANKTREAGYKHIEAYTPFPIEGLSEAVGFRQIADRRQQHHHRHGELRVDFVMLGASIFAVDSMLALNTLPQPYHAVFNVDRFSQASTDKFFLCIEARDPKFDLGATAKFLQSLHATHVNEVKDEE